MSPPSSISKCKPRRKLAGGDGNPWDNVDFIVITMGTSNPGSMRVVQMIPVFGVSRVKE
jgi:hypothetical protein